MTKKINRVLTVVLLAILLTVCVGSLATYGRTYARGFFKTYTTALPKDPTIFDNLKARITKLSGFLEQYLFLQPEFTEINTTAQYLTGKDLLSVSYGNMITLDTGELYTLEPALDLDLGLQSFIDQKNGYDGKDIGFFYVYAHSLLYDGVELPAGAEVFDYNIENADHIVSTLRGAGVNVIDSRDVYREQGLTVRDANNVTDYHWRHRIALASTYALAKEIAEKTDVPAAYENLAFENFDVEVVDRIMFGKYGQRVGSLNLALDDVWLMTPEYETDYTVQILTGKKLEERSGSFADAVIHREMLDTDRYGRALEANYVYGDYRSIAHYVNSCAPEGKALVIRDSFGTPVGSFLSLAMRDVYSVDLRYTDKTLDQWVEEVDPDVVVYAYSQNMILTLQGQIGED